MSNLAPSKSTPILMSGPMIRAIQQGIKTETRRVVWPIPDNVDEPWPNSGSHVTWADILEHTAYYVQAGHCRFGRVHDYLWVRETWQIAGWFADYERALVRYQADPPGGGTWITVPANNRHWLETKIKKLKGKYHHDVEDQGKFHSFRGQMAWQSSLFMPRWASRYTLQITDIDTERLQAITAYGAIAEGIDKAEVIRKLKHANGSTWSPQTEAQAYVEEYRLLWDSLQDNLEEAGFDANPYVWVLRFQRVETPHGL